MAAGVAGQSFVIILGDLVAAGDSQRTGRRLFDFFEFCGEQSIKFCQSLLK